MLSSIPSYIGQPFQEHFQAEIGRLIDRFCYHPQRLNMTNGTKNESSLHSMRAIDLRS